MDLSHHINLGIFRIKNVKDDVITLKVVLVAVGPPYLVEFIKPVHLVVIIIINLFNIGVLVSLIVFSYPIKLPAISISVLQHLFLPVLDIVVAAVQVESEIQIPLFNSVIILYKEGQKVVFLDFPQLLL